MLIKRYAQCTCAHEINIIIVRHNDMTITVLVYNANNFCVKL